MASQHDVFQKQYIKRRRFHTKCKYKIVQTTNKEYIRNKDNWEIIFEPGEKAQKYKKKITKKDNEKQGKGKCLLDFSKYANQKIQNLL